MDDNVMIHPSEVLLWRDGGTGNMGDVTDESDMTARLRVPGHRIVPVFVRAHFKRVQGSGTEIADMTMNIDSAAGVFFDHELFLWENVGEAEDAVLRVEASQLVHYLLDVGDELVFEWANPDSGDITWGIEVGYILADSNGRS